MKKKSIINISAGLLVIASLLFGGNFVKNNEELNKETKNVSVNDVLSIYYFDVGQADAILLQDGDKNMIIDSDNNEDGNGLVNTLKNDLKINTLDYAITTHPHEDHIGGMDDVINNFNIKNFYMPDVITTTKTFEDMLDALENKNMSFTVPKEDDSFMLGSSKIDFLYVGNNAKELNDASIILKVTHGNNTFLFTGDASSKVEKEILNKNIESDVLKVGHHGSYYSTCDAFLDKVNPKYAVISVGKGNSYKHPAFETLKKLENKNIKIYRTDEVGTIKITSDGSNLKIDSERTNIDG